MAKLKNDSAGMLPLGGGPMGITKEFPNGAFKNAQRGRAGLGYRIGDSGARLLVVGDTRQCCLMKYTR